MSISTTSDCAIFAGFTVIDQLEEEWQGEGQVAHGDDHQQHHQAHGEGQVGLGELREPNEKGRVIGGTDRGHPGQR